MPINDTIAPFEETPEQIIVFNEQKTFRSKRPKFFKVPAARAGGPEYRRRTKIPTLHSLAS